MNTAVILDRDDTIIVNHHDLGDPQKVQLVRDAPAAIASLRGLGYKIIVVTNQGGVARGQYTPEDVDAVNQRINELIRASTGAFVDRFYYCPYHPKATVEKYRKEDHPWRKPAPGMLLQAAKDFDLDLERSWMIGDQVRDVQAGAAAKTKTILLRNQHTREYAQIHGPQPESDDPDVPNFIVASLTEAAKIIAQYRITSGSDLPRRGAPVEIKAQPTPIPITPTKPDAPDKPQKPAGPAPAAKEVTPPRPIGPAEATPVTVPESPPKGETDTIDVDEEELADASATVMLKKILQELRNQRAIQGQFATPTVIAVVVQVIAAVCFIAAFMIAPDQAGFLRWMGAAMCLELAVIAALLFGRH